MKDAASARCDRKKRLSDMSPIWARRSPVGGIASSPSTSAGRSEPTVRFARNHGGPGTRMISRLSSEIPGTSKDFVCRLLLEKQNTTSRAGADTDDSRHERTDQTDRGGSRRRVHRGNHLRARLHDQPD